jgi:hypothetical protein
LKEKEGQKKLIDKKKCGQMGLWPSTPELKKSLDV